VRESAEADWAAEASGEQEQPQDEPLAGGRTDLEELSAAAKRLDLQQRADEQDAPAPDLGLDALQLRSGSGPDMSGKTAVSGQSLALPQGAGTIGGMGESFSTLMSTGVATTGVAFLLPRARGSAQPTLGLVYSSASGAGLAGLGWNIGVPFIARRTDQGVPGYADPPEGGDWTAGQDRFVYNGADLVPICTVHGGSCTGALSGERMPLWANQWQYFHLRVEGQFLRFFWSPDHRTWRVQDKSGTTMELGVPLNGSSDDNALEVATEGDQGRIFRWNLARQYDVHGDGKPAEDAAPRPYNIVAYRYFKDAGTSYPSDIYDTPPAANPADAPLQAYAHHTRLVWELRSDPATSYRRGWGVQQRYRLARVDVTSKTFQAPQSPRRLVRSYRLGYQPVTQSHISLLASAQLVGRCSGEEEGAPAEGNDGIVPVTNCGTMPPTTFRYSQVGDGGAAQLVNATQGFGAFDATVRDVKGSPPIELNGRAGMLMDINGDGLVDVYHPDPGHYHGGHGVFLNGENNEAASFGAAKTVSVTKLQGPGVPTVDAFTLTPRDPNVLSMDFDGNGFVDLVYMPRLKAPVVFGVEQINGGYTWKGRVTKVPTQQLPVLDLANPTYQGKARMLDVNGDGLIDIVVAGGTSLETYFNLAGVAGGDGRFGHVVVSDTGAVELSREPVRTCLPGSAVPMTFTDPAVRLADMNGDGLVDMVRVKRGYIEYWPGRGDGRFGDGALARCRAGAVQAAPSIVMTNSPMAFSDFTTAELGDVNGDGLPDLVLTKGAVSLSVWLNVDGRSWTAENVIAHHVPMAWDRPIQIADLNGSGTPDVVWGNAGKYQYMDLLGGHRPYILTRVSNGLGMTRDIETSASTQEMLDAARSGVPWATTLPMVQHVAKRVTVRDHLGKVGRQDGAYVTEYEYRDPVYDPRQREFRGFRVGRAKTLGDEVSPTVVTESRYLLGECEDGVGEVGYCAPEARWMPNPREALKGLPVISSMYDEAGVTLGTTHNGYALRRMYVGLDGVPVHYAYLKRTDNFTYDTANWDGRASTISLADVEEELSPGVVAARKTGVVALGATAGRVRTAAATYVDAFGNAAIEISYGCIQGCAKPDETILSYFIPAVAAGDGSGWMWRNTQSYVTGASKQLRRRLWVTHDDRGRPISSRAELRGSLPLDRFHETGAPIAPAPWEASKDGTIVLSSTTYDAFGNPDRSTAPNGRCGDTDVDSAYAQLVVREVTFAGPRQGQCGTRQLVTQAEYDRGAELIRRVTSFNGEASVAKYDDLGRVAEVFKPDRYHPGEVEPWPDQVHEYLVTTDPENQPYSIVASYSLTDAPNYEPEYHTLLEYSDGLGRRLLTLSEADPSAGDGGEWVLDGWAEYTKQGLVWKTYRAWFFSGDDPLKQQPAAPFEQTVYDAFGRPLMAYATDGTPVVKNVYHALSQDAWDANDLAQGPHSGTYSTVISDGHGRKIDQIERVRVGQSLELRHVTFEYLSTGEPYRVTRTKDGAEPVVRWMTYDTLGRLVMNVEPNSSKNFTADPATADLTRLKAWRYAYNDSGDMVGSSDARGCGSNYYYESGGRILAEDVSPCQGWHSSYTPPNLDTGDGTESYYQYDAADPDTIIGLQDLGCEADTRFLQGRVVSVSSRGSKTAAIYDGLGQTTCSLRKMAKPGFASAALTERYAPRWYAQRTDYDAAGRVTRATTGAAVAENMGQGFESAVTVGYTRAGVAHHVGSSYGDLIASNTVNANGQTVTVTYGDIAATQTAYTYDERSRVKTVQTKRGPPALWNSTGGAYRQPAPGSPNTRQLQLENTEFVYDPSGNPLRIMDRRNPAEWPSSAKPVSRTVQYDDLYRVSNVSYQVESGDDQWVSPFDAENRSGEGAQPSPHVSFAKRILGQSYEYDWLGNTTRTTDDVNGFYDRSLGRVQNGTATSGPYQLKSARAESGTDGLDARYDDAGNLLEMVVRRSGSCLPVGSSCWQRFSYDWDEGGRLARARRWDLKTSNPNERAAFGSLSAAAPTRAPDVELRYAYTASDDRTHKTAVDANGVESHTLYIFGSLELRGAKWTGTDYERTAATEVVYLGLDGDRLARVKFFPGDVPEASSGKVHVLLELGDHLGSTSSVLDKDTSELVERSTYQPYGAAESDYRPDRWSNFREDYRFTGKEEDVEVGLQYFGKRYYAPALGRWISADPLGMHKVGGDLNTYAYVHGRAFATVDPNGECELICIMIISAVAMMAYDAYSQYTRNGNSWNNFNGGELVLAGAAGGVGGGVGAALFPVIAPAIGAGAASMVAGGAGLAATNMPMRGGMTALQGGSAGDVVGSALNPVEMGKDFAMGAAMGGVAYGVGQLLPAMGQTSGGTGAAGATKAELAEMAPPKDLGPWKPASPNAQLPTKSLGTAARPNPGNISTELTGANELHMVEKVPPQPRSPQPATKPAPSAAPYD
jgi:RHS repeat-associated protein